MFSTYLLPKEHEALTKQLAPKHCTLQYFPPILKEWFKPSCQNNLLQNTVNYNVFYRYNSNGSNSSHLIIGKELVAQGDWHVDGDAPTRGGSTNLAPPNWAVRSHNSTAPWMSQNSTIQSYSGRKFTVSKYMFYWRSRIFYCYLSLV